MGGGVMARKTKAIVMSEEAIAILQALPQRPISTEETGHILAQVCTAVCGGDRLEAVFLLAHVIALVTQQEAGEFDIFAALGAVQ